MHETRALWLLVLSVTIHLYNDQYTVRLSGLTETTVSTWGTIMGSGNYAAAARDEEILAWVQGQGTASELTIHSMYCSIVDRG